MADYFIVAHDNIPDIVDFCVLNVNDFIRHHNLIQYGTRKVSDHHILLCTARVDNNIGEVTDGRTNTADNSSGGTSTGTTSQTNSKSNSAPTRYKKGKLPDDFMNSETTIANCEELIDDLLNKCRDQEELDALYDKYVHNNSTTLIQILQSNVKLHETTFCCRQIIQ